MASVHRRRFSKFWVAAYRLPDGTRRQRSTGSTNKTTALQIALAAERAARGHLTAQTAHALINDILSHDPDGARPQETTEDYFARWLARRGRELADGTADRYRQVVEAFTATLPADRLTAPLHRLAARDLSAFRDQLAGSYAPGTVNFYLKILKAALAEAATEGVIASNPAAGIRLLKTRSGSPRRALTAEEIKALLAATKPEDEWRGMILAGLYTGQRLGDIATMRRADLENGWWRFTARKTGARMAIPLAPPLAKWLRQKPSTPDPYVFPKAAARVAAAKGKTGTLSNQFHARAAMAGLVEARGHTSRQIGRTASRTASAVSFHCLRHTTNTLLKSAGVPESVAMALLGHASKDISRLYTHLPESALAEAIRKLG